MSENSARLTVAKPLADRGKMTRTAVGVVCVGCDAAISLGRLHWPAPVWPTSRAINLYAVKVWHPSALRRCETVTIRTYSAGRTEALASESFPGCLSAANALLVSKNGNGRVVRRNAQPRTSLK